MDRPPLPLLISTSRTMPYHVSSVSVSHATRLAHDMYLDTYDTYAVPTKVLFFLSEARTRFVSVNYDPDTMV